MPGVVKSELNPEFAAIFLDFNRAGIGFGNSPSLFAQPATASDLRPIRLGIDKGVQENNRPYR
jgi:hypothetical protein